MKVNFLIQQHACNGLNTVSCASLKWMSEPHNSYTDAESEIRDCISEYLVTTAADYVKTYFKADSAVNCPEGFVKLPIDLWFCKLTKATCQLQAQVFLKDRDKFFSGCTAPEKQKNGIFTAATDGRYKGFHHVPGRYQCPTCDTDTSYDYHYVFELTLITDIIGKNKTDNALIKQIIHLELPRSVLLCPLCPKCALDTIQIIAPNIAKDLRVIEFEFNPR